MADRNLALLTRQPDSKGIAGGPVDELDVWTFAPGTWPNDPQVEVIVEGFFRDIELEYRFGLSRAQARELVAALDRELAK